MSKLGIVVAAVLSLSMVALAVYSWISLSDIEMDASGYIALVLGGLATVGLGVGLMGLVFYSNRKGYDQDAAGPLSHGDPKPR
jgi:hypothetical protein